MGIANPKPTIDTHTHKTNKQTKAIQTTLKMTGKPQQNKGGRAQKRPTKTNPKELRKWH